MYAHTRRKLLYIEISEKVFERVSERYLDFGSVDPENGRIVGRGQGPVIPHCSRFKILDTYPGSIDSDSLWKGFSERFKEFLQFLGLVCEEILPKVFHEALVDFGFVFFHF